MKVKEKFVQLWNKFSRWLSVKKLAIGAFAAFLLSLLPILYLTVVNRASGDDYGYGKYTRPAWAATHSLIEVAKAIGQTIRQYYYGWQGTWFSIALFYGNTADASFMDWEYVLSVPGNTGTSRKNRQVGIPSDYGFISFYQYSVYTGQEIFPLLV